MKEVEYRQFLQEYRKFREKHGGINKTIVETDNDKTFNEYFFKDNSKWYEIIENECHTIEKTIHGLNFIHKIFLIKITYWNSESSTQKVTYEKG